MALTPFAPGFFGLGFDQDFFAGFGPLFDPRSVAGTLARDREYTRGIALDIAEKDDKFELKADLPGVPKEDIKLNIDGDVLSLSVEKESSKEEDKEEQGVKYHRVERSSVYQRRSVRLPESADLDNINAKYENGVLSLDIPKVKAQEQKPRAITIS